MTETNFRALCAELLAAIQLYTKLNPAASEMSAFELTEKLMDAMAATNAALAQPEPGEVGELIAWLHDHALNCRELGRNDWAAQVTSAATLLAQQSAPALAQPEPVAPTDAASRVAHYLEQRRLIRGLDPEVINALHAGTDEPRQAALTVSDLEELARAVLARWGTPTNTINQEDYDRG
jgi:hypothetical protein